MSGRLLGVVAASLVAGGCASFREQLSARSDVAAEVGEHRLTAERVGSILSRSGGSPTLQAAEFVANLWLDYSLFADAVAGGRLATDSATVARVMWPEVSQARVNMWLDSLRRRAAPVAAGAVDSVYRAGEVRVFQHIIAIPTNPTAADTAAAQRSIRESLSRVRTGGDFGAIASEVSADGSKTDQGYLAVGPRGQFVPEFENAAWALEPGQVSEVVKSQFGWHVIRRPTLEEARPRFTTWLQTRTAARTDSALFAGLQASHQMKVAGGAPAAMRTAAGDPAAARRSSRALVNVAGPDITVGDFARWLGLLPLANRLQVRNASDSMLLDFAKSFGQLTLLLRQADSASFQLSQAQQQFVTLKYNNAIQAVRRDMGLEVPELSDSSRLSGEQRSRLAAEKVEEYFTKLLEGRAQMQQLLPALAADLRGGGSGRVNPAGVSRAVELALATRRRDSAAAAARGATAPAPGIIKAPGGPPVADTPR
jgi:hypothetical protein